MQSNKARSVRYRPTRRVLKVILACIWLGYVTSLSGHSSAKTGEVQPLPQVNQVNLLYLPLVLHERDTVFGIQMASATVSGAEQIKEANSQWVRGVRIPWRDVEPTPGDRLWSAVSTQEAGLVNLTSRRLRPIVMVSHTPLWAQKLSGYACGPIDAAYLNEFGSFMHDLVKRYSAAPYNAQYFEIWNEPDVDPQIYGTGESWVGCWGDANDEYYGGGYFADMLQAVYPRVKEANPTAQVLIGGLLSYCNPEVSNGCQNVNPPGSKPYNFFEGILRHHGLNDGGQYFDGVDFSAYDFYQGQLGRYGVSTWNSRWDTTGPVMIAKAQFFRSKLEAYGVSGKYLINTEAALACALSQAECESDIFEISKAYYVAHAYTAAMSIGLRASIWYSLEGWPERYTALVDANGNPQRAYRVYQFVANELGSTSFVRVLTDDPGVWVYEFTRQDLRIWVLWSRDGYDHPVSLPGSPLRMYDVYGNSLPVDQTIIVTLAPYFVEWRP